MRDGDQGRRHDEGATPLEAGLETSRVLRDIDEALGEPELSAPPRLLDTDEVLADIDDTLRPTGRDLRLWYETPVYCQKCL
jgi:hypothetical protein